MGTICFVISLVYVLIFYIIILVGVVLYIFVGNPKLHIDQCISTPIIEVKG